MAKAQDTRKFTLHDLTDDGLRRVLKQYRRELEDIEDGDLYPPRRPFVERELASCEQVIATRAALRECWLASEDGTDSSADFEFGQNGRRIMRGRPPSYKLATMFDYERHLRGESTVLAWA